MPSRKEIGTIFQSLVGPSWRSTPKPTSRRADTEPQDHWADPLQHSAGLGLEPGFENRLGTLVWWSTTVLTCMFRCVVRCNSSVFHQTLLKEIGRWANHTVQQEKPSVLFSAVYICDICDICQSGAYALISEVWPGDRAFSCVPLFAWKQPETETFTLVKLNSFTGLPHNIETAPLFGDVYCATSIFK